MAQNINPYAPAAVPVAAPPAQESDDAWYQRVIVARPDKYDTNVPKEQWLAWRPLYNERTGGWKSSKVDWKTKKPIESEGDDPDDCPPGMAAWGPNACRPEGAWQQGAEGQGKGAAAAAAPATPVTQGKAGALTYLTPEQLKAQGASPLVNTLLEMFNTQQGPAGEANLFGFQGGRTAGPATYEGDLGAPTGLPEAPSITGRLLKGGGLYWGGEGVNTAQPAAAAPQAARPAPAQPAPQAAPAAPAVPPPPEVSAGPPQATAPAMPGAQRQPQQQFSPLQSMLIGQQQRGKFKSNPFAYFGG